MRGLLCQLIAMAAMLYVASPSALAAPDKGGGTTFLVSGQFEYEDKAWDFEGWTGDDPRLPIRFADVIVRDEARGKVIGRGMTDNFGEFSVECSTKLQFVDLLVSVSAESRMRAKADKTFPRLRVATPQRTVYSAFAPSVPGHPAGQDVDVGTTTVLKSVLYGKEGNPFNVFDLAVNAFEYVTSPEVGLSRRGRSMRITWPSFMGSFSIGRRAWVSTGDGYDDSVILHEIGHMVHNVYSDSDNPGGPHFFGDSDQDLRLSFGEGWATAFAGIVLDRMNMPAIYVDSKGSIQMGGAQLHLDLESAAPFAEESVGAGDEIAVACVLYDLLDDDDLSADSFSDDDTMISNVSVDGRSPTQAWWEVFTGPMRRARHVNVNHAWDAWLQEYEQPEYSRLVDVFEDRDMEFWKDAWEPDDSPDEAVSVGSAELGGWSPDHTLYSQGEAQFGPGTGDRDWYAVELQVGQSIQIETRYPAGTSDAGTQADPFLALYDPNGRLVAKDDDSGYRRNALLSGVIAGESGTWRFVVKSKNKRNRYGRYNVRVSVQGG